MLTDLKITDFLQQTASGTPFPGGGSVAALMAALGAALAEMVANLTIGKKGYDGVEAEMKEIAATARHLREKLVAEVDNDSNAYRHVIAAFKLPKTTQEEQEERMQAIENAMQKAARVPLAVAQLASQVMDLAEIAIQKGNQNTVTDGAVGALAARTAVLGALYNVKINLTSIKGAAFIEEMQQEVAQLERQVRQRENEVLSNVKI